MSTPYSNRFLVFGFIGAMVATTVGAALTPDDAQSAVSVFVRAAAYILLVLAASAITAYWGLRARGEGQATRARELAICTAAAMLWLTPLWMFASQRSWFVAVIGAWFVLEAARLTTFVKGMTRDNLAALPQMPPNMFSVLSQDLPSAITILAALLIQGAIFSSIGGHALAAALFYLAGIAVLAYRALRMFQDFPSFDSRTLKRRIPATLIAATLLILFAWLPEVGVSGGSGSGGGSSGTAESNRPPTLGHSSNGGGGKEKHTDRSSTSALARLRDLLFSRYSQTHGDSFAAAKRIFNSKFAPEVDGSTAALQNRYDTKIAAVEFVAGPVFAGVELYPVVKPYTRLVAPPLPDTRGSSASHSDPLSIPFDGVYWFWRGPSQQPPSNSVVMHGNPSARFFRSTDGDGMSMEARQNLGFSVDPKRYGAIEILIENADPFPNTVSVLLRIRNTAAPSMPALTLGMEDVPAPAHSSGSGASQTLRFVIPSTIRMGRFDELTVSYYLKGERSDRSARIAVDRFRLVPRGG